MELSDATEKSPEPPGIDPGTFRPAAQCLNHYATPPSFLNPPSSRSILLRRVMHFSFTLKKYLLCDALKIQASNFPNKSNQVIVNDKVKSRLNPGKAAHILSFLLDCLSRNQKANVKGKTVTSGKKMEFNFIAKMLPNII
jgi:hypothetical protein